jgi:hypothetical protein
MDTAFKVKPQEKETTRHDEYQSCFGDSCGQYIVRTKNTKDFLRLCTISYIQLPFQAALFKKLPKFIANIV